LDALTTLAELFIGIAGFSGIVVALSGASVASDPLDRFRVLALLMLALGGAVFAVLPLILSDAGLSLERTWMFASGAYSAYFALVVAWTVHQRMILPAAVLQSLHPIVWLASVGGCALSSVALCVNATGWPVSSSSALYLYPLLYSLLLSCVLFVRLLIVRPGHPPAV
jgi:hypothetical protein